MGTTIIDGDWPGETPELKLTFTEHLPGDSNNNGIVDIHDITPIAQLWPRFPSSIPFTIALAGL